MPPSTASPSPPGYAVAPVVPGPSTPATCASSTVTPPGMPKAGPPPPPPNRRRAIPPH